MQAQVVFGKDRWMAHTRLKATAAGDRRGANNHLGHEQRKRALDERERLLDRREDRIAEREHTADLRDTASDRRRDIDSEELYPGMED
jgi:hypothetical protein